MRQINLKSHYDLVVVGGGIQGCAMLWEAQSRGLNTLLVEAQDYCSQTSANSLKTIHGGIRYLQTMNLDRTWRSSKEQETLIRIAPHLVHPLPCLLPTERNLKRSRLAVAVGFSLYNLVKKLSCPDQKLLKARCLSRSQLAEYTHRLDQKNVTGAGLWYDAQVQHAEQLGLAFIKTAMHDGGDAYNYLKADSVLEIENQQFELNLNDQIGDQKYKIATDTVIFCIASNSVQNLIEASEANVNHSKFCLAVNLVTKKRYADVAIGLQSGFAVQKLDSSGRLLFAAPWRDSTLFGTWYFDRAKQLKPSTVQIQFCLDDANKTYPGVKLGKDDIGLIHAGLLPINGRYIHPEKDLVEQDLIQQHKHQNLFSVIPTKYTTCRATAEEAINQLGGKINKAVSPSISAKVPLIGGQINHDWSNFLKYCQQKYSQQLPDNVINQLAINYGDQIEKIVELCNKDNALSELIPGADDHIKGQLEYELENGQVQRLSDFVLRRSSLGNSQIPNHEALKYCAQRINRFHSIHTDHNLQINELLNNTLYLKPASV